MRIIYNGIDLGVLETYSYDFEPVYDDSGLNYLYTKVLIVVRAMVNGQAEVLNPTPGVPFNGPPISYAFSNLQSQPHKPSLPGELRTGTPAFPEDGNKVRPALPPYYGNFIQIGGGVEQMPNFKFNDPVKKKPEFVPAKKIPKENKIDGAINPGAYRPFASPVVTKAGQIGTLPQDMNVKGTSGVDSFPKSTLRKVLRVPNAAPLSHIAIRHRLTTPQGRLFIFSGPGQESGALEPGSDAAGQIDPPAQLWLESPQDERFRVDCKNGPKPKVLGVHMVAGDANTLLVDWQCETYIHEAHLNFVQMAGILLSHTFSQTQSTTQDGYSVIGTAGTAVFRTDFVYALPETPDFKRPVLFMPVPQGFVREIKYVTGRPDVTGVDYGYVDTQVSSNFVAGVYARAASMAAVHRQAIVSGEGILRGALTTYERVLNLMSQFRFATEKSTPGGPPVAGGRGLKK